MSVRVPAAETAETPEADADRLIAAFRLRAYSEARGRQRQAQGSDAAAHWGEVAKLIAQRMGERPDAQSRSERALRRRVDGRARGLAHALAHPFFRG